MISGGGTTEFRVTFFMADGQHVTVYLAAFELHEPHFSKKSTHRLL